MIISKIKICVNALLGLLLCIPEQYTMATPYILPEAGSSLIGQNKLHITKKGDYFQEIAERYNVGFYALLAANPSIDPFLIKPGADVLIPSQMLLPHSERQGIVINLAELRLYYFPEHSNIVHVFPVGIGRIGLDTPIMTSYISQKIEKPTWRPTEATQRRYLETHQKILPKEVPPGPDNPFGDYALRLGYSVYLIHGSNKRFGIGMRASAGCIRMFDEDIKWLYENIPLNTPVKIINEPLKFSVETDNLLLIELHEPLTIENNHQSKEEQKNKMINVVAKIGGVKNMASELMETFLEQPTGLVYKLPIPKTGER